MKGTGLAVGYKHRLALSWERRERTALYVLETKELSKSVLFIKTPEALYGISEAQHERACEGMYAFWKNCRDEYLGQLIWLDSGIAEWNHIKSACQLN